MSGLNNFVHRNNEAPTSGQPLANRDAIGKEAKVRITRSNNKSGHSQQSISTAPPANYATNSTANRNHVLNQYEQYQQPENFKRGLLVDDTVTSGFEDTISDLGRIQQHGRDRAEHNGDYELELGASDGELSEDAHTAYKDASTGHTYGRNGQKQHTLARHAGRSPVMDRDRDPDPETNIRGPTMSSINNRFAQAGQNPPQFDNMQLRQSQQVSKGRGRSDEHGYNVESQQIPNQHADYDLPILPTNGHTQKANGARNNLDGSVMEDTLEESPTDQQGRLSGEFPSSQIHDRNHIDDSADYTNEQLGAMQYEDLKKETWETELHGKRQRESQEEQGEPGPLKVRLEGVLNIQIVPKEEIITEHGKDAAAEAVREELWQIHSNFFKDLPITEWEESGELLIGKMSEIMQKMVNARQEKRKMVSKFEKQIEERESLVRGKSGYLDEKLKDMKKSGLGLLNGTGS